MKDCFLENKAGICIFISITKNESQKATPEMKKYTLSLGKTSAGILMFLFNLQYKGKILKMATYGHYYLVVIANNLQKFLEWKFAYGYLNLNSVKHLDYHQQVENIAMWRFLTLIQLWLTIVAEISWAYPIPRNT